MTIGKCLDPQSEKNVLLEQYISQTHVTLSEIATWLKFLVKNFIEEDEDEDEGDLVEYTK